MPTGAEAPGRTVVPAAGGARVQDASSGARDALGSLVVGAAIVAATVGWWLYAAPQTTSSAVASLIVQFEASGWDGAIVAPIMVGAAWTAGLIPLAFARPWAIIPAAASLVATTALALAAISAVAGELATLGPEDIAAMPLPAHAIGTWAALVLASVIGSAIGASNARRPGISHAVAASLLAGYAVVAVLLARVGDRLQGYGFALLTGLAGIWLAARLWRS